MNVPKKLIEVRTTLGETIRAQGNATWNVSEPVGLFLRDLVITRNAKHILEIGTSIGYSALFLDEGARNTGGHVTTIESHSERREKAKQSFKEAEVDNFITLVEGHAPEIFSSLTGTWDFIFFDATKYEHISYIQALLPHLEEQVCIVADNCISHAEAMTPYIAYMRNLPGFTHELLDKGSGLFVSTRL
jgi:predicted O-methyltransferase YrrM